MHCKTGLQEQLAFKTWRVAECINIEGQAGAVQWQRTVSQQQLKGTWAGQCEVAVSKLSLAGSWCQWPVRCFQAPALETSIYLISQVFTS